MQLFVDMDGVLADFDLMHRHCFGVSRERHTGWKHVQARPHFFLDMPPMADMPDLWKAIHPLAPTVLTGVPSSVNAACNEKIQWCAENLRPLPPVICCQAKEKFLHCKPGDILIDDTEEYRPPWEAAGGVWVQHTCALDTINQLRRLGVL